jgi:uncharacterized protein DUF4082
MLEFLEKRCFPLLMLAFFGLCVFSPASWAGNITLAWDANTESNLGGYRLFWGKASRSYSNNLDVGNVTWYTLTLPDDGTTTYFAITAYSSDRMIESGYSNEVVRVFYPAPPPAYTCPCTIWPSTTRPTIVADSDTNAVELGLRFKADVNGYISGVRFYKSTYNTGTHVGRLWSNSGQLLAQATFTNETASGWQQVNFATPVAIIANTPYVISYHVPSGRYSVDNDYFASTGIDNPPLHALRNGVSGGNGVYRYGAGGVFPTYSWRSSSYWVQPVFVLP